MNNTNDNSQFVDVEIVGQTFCVACNADNKQSLLDSVDFLNEKVSQVIQEIGNTPKRSNTPIRLVITAALQIISDFLLTQQVLRQLITQSDIKDSIAADICHRIKKFLTTENKTQSTLENDKHIK